MRRHTIRTHLIAYAIVILVPMLALAALLAFRYAGSERAVIEAQQLDVVNNLAFLIDREVEGVTGALDSLAASPALKSGDLESARQHLQAATNIRGLNAISIIDRSGQILLSTAVPPGEPLPMRDDPKTFAPVFENHTSVSDLTYGKLSKTPIFIVSAPVTAGGKVLYALSAGIKVERLAALFGEVGLKPDWLAIVLDRKGRLLARSENGDRYVGSLARSDVVAAATNQERGIVPGRTREGTPVSDSFRRSSVSGWTALIAVPTATLNAPLSRALWLLGLVSAVILALAVAAAGWMGRRISQPINHLKTSALDVLDGRAPSSPPNSIAELEEVENVFQYTASINAERKRLQEKLQQAIDVAAIGIFERDHATEQLTMSEALRDMLGFEPGDAVVPMQRARDIVAAEDRAAVAERSREARDPAADGRFVSEHRILRADGVRWLSVRAQTWFEDLDGIRQPVRTVGAVRDITERKWVEEQLQLLTREMAHRSKNLLAIIQSIAAQTVRSSDTKESFQRAFGERLRGLAASIDLLVHRNWSGAPLGELVRRQLEPFLAPPDARLALSGPEISIDVDAAQALGMALHELATNSSKYGALSVASGRLAVTWTLPPNGACGDMRIVWEERDGPLVTVPVKKGFGHVVMERMVAQSLGAKVDIDFAPQGLRWQLTAPADRIVSGGAPQVRPALQPS